MAESFDAVVVGGGILGAAVAEALAVAGRRVALLERGRLAEAASGNSFAWVNATAKTEAADYHRLNAAGVAEYQRLAQRYGADAIGLAGEGGLHWGAPAAVGRLAARLAALGYPHRRLDAAGLRRLEPGIAVDDGAAGLLAPADRWLDAPRCAARLARAVEAAGGAVRERCPVTGFPRDAGGHVRGVHTYAGTIAAPAVVLAAGTETAALAALATEGGWRPPLRAVPGLLLDLPPDLAGGLVRGHVLHPPGPEGLDLRPGADGGLLVGAEIMTEALADEAPPALLRAAPGRLLPQVAAVLPGLPLAAALSRAVARIGVRPIPGDGRTVAGSVPGAPGLFVAVTHSGVTLAPLLGRLLAAEIAGAPPAPLLAPFRPDRFAGASAQEAGDALLGGGMGAQQRRH